MAAILVCALGTGCATPREAALPTPAEVEGAVAASFGDPKEEMDFTERSVLLRLGYADECPMGRVMPSLVHWQREAPEAPLIVGPWELTLLPPGERPRGTVALYDVEVDGSHGLDGVYFSLCARPVTPGARVRARHFGEAELPTPAEVQEAVAAAFGPPEGEIDRFLDFTGQSMCIAVRYRAGQPMVAALPALFRWQQEGAQVPLRIGDWELSLLPGLGDPPEGTVCVYEEYCDGGMGSDGFVINLCAKPMSPAARARVRRVRG